MHKKDRNILDATLVNVIGNAAFTAELKNGHRFVAFAAKRTSVPLSDLDVGDEVAVEMSSYDMSKGRIVSKSMGRE